MTAPDMHLLIDLSLMRAGDNAATLRVWDAFYDGFAADLYADPDAYTPVLGHPAIGDDQRDLWELLRAHIAATNAGDADRRAALDTQIGELLDSETPDREGRSLIGRLMDFYETRAPFQLTPDDWHKIATVPIPMEAAHHD